MNPLHWSHTVKEVASIILEEFQGTICISTLQSSDDRACWKLDLISILQPKTPQLEE